MEQLLESANGSLEGRPLHLCEPCAGSPTERLALPLQGPDSSSKTRLQICGIFHKTARLLSSTRVYAATATGWRFVVACQWVLALLIGVWHVHICKAGAGAWMACQTAEGRGFRERLFKLWRQVTSHCSGHVFYYNPTTGESSWNPPPEMAAQAPPLGGSLSAAVEK